MVINGHLIHDVADVGRADHRKLERQALKHAQAFHEDALDGSGFALRQWWIDATHGSTLIWTCAFRPYNLVNEMQLDLTPNLMNFLQSAADKNGIAPEDVVRQIIQSEMVVAQKRENDKRRTRAPVNLALFETSRFATALERGKEARAHFKIDELDRRDSAVLVFIPDDLTMSLSFFTGLFDQSLMMMGPRKFLKHYVFDADVGNIQLVDRYARMVWEKTKDIELYRLTVQSKGESDASYTAWLKTRDEDTLEISDETPVGDFLSHSDALVYVAARNGRVVEGADPS